MVFRVTLKRSPSPFLWMEDRSRETNHEALLEDMAWCGRLAHRLTQGRDPWDEDAFQEAWVLALRVRPPFPLSASRLKAWFRGLAWNRLRERRRSEACRAARERAVSRPEAQESVLDVLERSETQRRLHEAVMALADPYRSTLLRRYFDGLASVQIAELEGVSPVAIRKRLSRAIEELRIRLDREFEDRRRWLAALAPLASPFEPEGGAAGNNGPAGTILATPLGAGLALGFLVLAATLWIAMRDEGGREALETRAPVANALRDELPTRLPMSAADRDEEPRRAPVVRPDSANVDTNPDASTPRVTGRVVDAAGGALGNVALRTVRTSDPEGSYRTTSSGADGSFALKAVPAFDRIVSDDPSFATVLAGVGRSSAEAEVLVVLAPAQTLTGRVVDEEGRPIARARVFVRSKNAFGANLGVSLDHSVEVSHATRTGSDGRFRLENIPGHEAARLVVESVGYRRLARRVRGTEEFELTLRRETPPPDALRGIVLGPDGMPMDEVLVSDGTRSTRTSRGGRFALPTSRRGEARLVAVHPRFLTLFQTIPPTDETETGEETAPVELRFGADPPRSLEGRVVDTQGAPVAGARVWIADPTPFGRYEGALALVESLNIDPDPSLWHWVESDASGRFRIDGLTDRPYRIAAIDPRTLRRGDVLEVEAAGEPLIRIQGEVRTNVTGRLVDEQGRPVPGAAITPARRTLDIRARNIDRIDELCLPTVHTDGEGRFVIPSVAASGVTLCIERAGVHALGEIPDADNADVVITLRPRTHLQVVVLNEEADAFGVLDEHGQARDLWMVRGRGVRQVQRAAILEGRSHRWVVDERAACVVLFRDGIEIRRAPLVLSLGTLNRIAF